MTGTVNHDQHFKNLIVDYPREALAFFAPEEAAGIDEHARIVPIRQEQLKERLSERFRELDVPLLVEWPNGRREALLFVLEEETDPGRFSIHRLAHYCLDLAELCRTDRVVPVVIFLKRAGRAPRRLALGGDRHTYLDFHYLRCALAELAAERYWDSDNLVARLNLPNMAWPPDRKVAAYAQAIKGLLNLESDTDKQFKYIEFVDIYAALDDNEQRQYEDQYPEEKAAMSGFVERYREEGIREGRQQGMEQGMEQGRQQGESAVLRKQLTRRFGTLDQAILNRLERASTADLEQWAENILDARTLEEVFTRH